MIQLSVISVVSVISVISVLVTALQPPTAEDHFRRGVEWLHSFEYEEAIESFRAAQKLDPSSAMAYWGEALCHSQPLWGREDPGAARQALGRARPRTPREAGYVRAARQLFGDGPSTALRAGDRRERQVAYSNAMKDVVAQNPDDLDALAFYGLSVLALRPRGIASHDHSAADRLADVGRPFLTAEAAAKAVRVVSAKDDDFSPRAAEVFHQVLAKNPDHPGALHYLIHAYDDPQSAHKALDAARRYARVAPAATHALHMPAHIFVQLGEWKDAVTSDTAAYRASVEWAKRKGLPDSMRSFHSLEWLHYEYLQLGEFQKARDLFDEIEPVAARSETADDIKTMVGLMRARQVIETEDWNSTRGQQQYRNYVELFGLGFSAARRGDVRVADMVRGELARLPSDAQYRGVAPMLSILERQVAAVSELASRRGDAAIELAKSAVAAESSLPQSSGPAEPIKPSSELLGEILLELNRPVEARAAFEAALGRVPGRRLSFAGLERTKLSATTSATPASTRPLRPTVAAAIIVGLAVVIGVAIRRRRAKPLSRQQRRRASRHP